MECVFWKDFRKKLEKKDILERQENYWNIVKLSLEIGVKAVFTERAQW